MTTLNLELTKQEIDLLIKACERSTRILLEEANKTNMIGIASLMREEAKEYMYIKTMLQDNQKL